MISLRQHLHLSLVVFQEVKFRTILYLEASNMGEVKFPHDNYCASFEVL